MKRELPTECGGCGLEERWLFHHVSVRNTYRRLCTSCVLKLHSGSFCPICFQVYGSNPPVVRAVCSRCPSVTHLDCVHNKDSVASYVCPPCSNPNFTFFDSTGENRVMNESMAKVLVAAAQIAYVTMSKAATEMRSESLRKVKEAAWKRKEAKESLQRLASLVTRDKKGKEPAVPDKSPAVVAAAGEQKNNVKGYGVVASQQRFENMLAMEANPSTPRSQQLRNNASIVAQVQNNAVVHEKHENGGLYSGNAEPRKVQVQHMQNGPSNDGQGNSKGYIDSKNGHHIAQPHQDSLVNKSGGVQLGSSNMAR